MNFIDDQGNWYVINGQFGHKVIGSIHSKDSILYSSFVIIGPNDIQKRRSREIIFTK